MSPSIARFAAKVVESEGQPLRARLDIVITACVEFYLENQRLSRELFTQGGRLGGVERVLAVRWRVVRVVASVEAMGEARAYVLVNALMGVLLTSVIDEHSPLNRERLIAELSRLCLGYLANFSSL